MVALADALDAALPQTQCTRCGFPDCRSYATAIAEGAADINRCPPGGAEGVSRLSALSGRPLQPLDPACGPEAPRHLAVIDEDACIGCTRCLPVCPVDCIVGGPKSMHTVIERLCTGCALCLPACPVDCIALVPASGDLTGWQAWSPVLAAQARTRYAHHQERLARAACQQTERLGAAPRAPAAGTGATAASMPQVASPSTTTQAEPVVPPPDAKAATIEAALRRAREARAARR